jgi:hypothetical protein
MQIELEAAPNATDNTNTAEVKECKLPPSVESTSGKGKIDPRLKWLT